MATRSPPFLNAEFFAAYPRLKRDRLRQQLLAHAGDPASTIHALPSLLSLSWDDVEAVEERSAVLSTTAPVHAHSDLYNLAVIARAADELHPARPP